VGKSVSIGLFGYSGRELVDFPFSPVTSNIKMFGPDLSLNLDEKLIVNLQYVRRTDSHVYGSIKEQYEDVMTQGGFGEIIFAPKGDNSKWYLTGLVNVVESDLDYLNYRSATIHAGYLLRRNLRLVSEYTWQFSGNPFGKANIGFVSAF
jgi:hypothetical protein